MKQKLIYFLLLIVILSSCGTAMLGSRVKNIELGMTKKEVIDIIGKNYTIVGKKQTHEGNMESLFFFSTLDSSYMFHFLNNKLVEFYIENDYNPYPVSRENVE